jgi:Effector Associated Constant Component 1
MPRGQCVAPVAPARPFGMTSPRCYVSMPEEQQAQARIHLTESDAHALSAWLNRAGHFRGLVDVNTCVQGRCGSTCMVDVVIVLVGSRMLALLVSKIYDWVAVQRGAKRVTATYTRPGGSPLEIEVDRYDDRSQLIDRVRRLVESGEARA